MKPFVFSVRNPVYHYEHVRLKNVFCTSETVSRMESERISVVGTSLTERNETKPTRSLPLPRLMRSCKSVMHVSGVRARTGIIATVEMRMNQSPWTNLSRLETRSTHV